MSLPIPHPQTNHAPERPCAGADEIAVVRTAIVALLPELRAYARFMLRDRDAADDMVQEALVRAIAALPRILAGTEPRAWMFTILRNAIFAKVRRARRDRALAAMTASVARAATDGAQLDTLALRDLSALLTTLSPVFREAVVLVGAQGLSYEEAAAIAGVAVGTMKARVSRARVMLARHAPTPG